jgi:hypothetical protein
VCQIVAYPNMMSDMRLKPCQIRVVFAIV